MNVIHTQANLCLYIYMYYMEASIPAEYHAGEKCHLSLNYTYHSQQYYNTTRGIVFREHLISAFLYFTISVILQPSHQRKQSH